MSGRWRCEPLGDGGLLVGCQPDEPEPAVALTLLTQALKTARLQHVSDYVAASTHLLLVFDQIRTSAAEIEQQVQACEVGEALARSSRVVEIVVRYGGEFGPDLDEIASQTSLTSDEIVALHTAQPMPVELVGFLPGFPYIGGLPAVLHLPRRATPRIAVPAGSVAIANGRSGIYPTTAPGGWHLIGRTDAMLFDPRREPPELVSQGEYVRFVAHR